MTQFSQLELLFNEYLILSKEIDSLIQNENYTQAVEDIKDRDKLVKKIFLAKKTATVDKEQEQKLQLIEKQMEENEKKHLSSLKTLHKDIGDQIKNTKGQIKISGAYSMPHKNDSGIFVDVTE